MSDLKYAIVLGVISAILYIEDSVLLILAAQILTPANNAGQKAFITLIYMAVGYKLLMIVMCGLMVVGVKKKRSQLIAPWLVMTAVDIVLSIVFGIYGNQARDIFNIFWNAIACCYIYLIWDELRTYRGSQQQQQDPLLPQSPDQPPALYPVVTPTNYGSTGDTSTGQTDKSEAAAVTNSSTANELCHSEVTEAVDMATVALNESLHSEVMEGNTE